MNVKKKVLDNHILAVSIGLIYIWFGALKFFPELSPAEIVAKDTIDFLTFGLIPDHISILLLAGSEIALGLLLVMNIYRRQVALLALCHMVGTFAPLFLFPERSFLSPFCFTLLGQYIAKNIIIVSALLTLYKIPVTKPKLA